MREAWKRETCSVSAFFVPSRQSNISTSGEERFKYPLPRENKISQMPYPRDNKDNQIPTPCPASPPASITLIGALYTTSSFLRGSTAPLAIRYVLMSCCCRQRRKGSHNRLMYGRTLLDLISAAGSFIRCLVLGFCEVRYKRIGEFLRDKTEDKCLFSSEIFMV